MWIYFCSLTSFGLHFVWTCLDRKFSRICNALSLSEIILIVAIEVLVVRFSHTFQFAEFNIFIVIVAGSFDSIRRSQCAIQYHAKPNEEKSSAKLLQCKLYCTQLYMYAGTSEWCIADVCVGLNWSVWPVHFYFYLSKIIMQYFYLNKQESPANAKGTRDSSACMKAHC